MGTPRITVLILVFFLAILFRLKTLCLTEALKIDEVRDIRIDRGDSSIPLIFSLNRLPGQEEPTTGTYPDPRMEMYLQG